MSTAGPPTHPSGRPRIGLTCSPLRVSGYYDPYLRAIETAGAEAVIITPPGGPVRPEQAATILAELDGLVVPGGWDVGPEEYGATLIPEMTQIDPALDRIEVELVRRAVDLGVPVFGICRGQQLINVALGGSLIQHLEGHDGIGQPRDHLSHTVAVQAGSDLAQVTPGELAVNSLHHQAVGELAPGLRATAHSPDGIIEALQSDDALVVAVQSHPEELVGDHTWAAALFSRFVERSASAVRRPAAGAADGG